ncbi:hypothetical protein MKW92_037320 [Papaver armeniacum]|nr:hypothetical protein MKW92_037320 [Papaver armeniacum]
MSSTHHHPLALLLQNLVDRTYHFDFQNLSWYPLPLYAYGLSISLGHHMYVLGGSVSTYGSPRGSFACIGKTKCQEILVAGGGSRHAMFSAAGRKVNSVECYNGRTNGVWGYGEPRTVSVVFPVDEYYKDGVISELKNGGNWEMEGNWGEWERRKLGNVVVVDGGANRDMPMVFMLDENDIFRYDNSSNRWVKESSIARKSPIDSSFGFAALNGDVHWSLQKTKGNITTRNVLRFSFKLTAPRGEHGDLWQQRHLSNPPWTLKLQ